MDRSPETRVEPRGWGIAAFICALAIACAVGAGYIHKRTYMDPTHPLSGVSGRATTGSGH